MPAPIPGSDAGRFYQSQRASLLAQEATGRGGLLVPGRHLDDPHLRGKERKPFGQRLLSIRQP